MLIRAASFHVGSSPQAGKQLRASCGVPASLAWRRASQRACPERAAACCRSALIWEQALALGGGRRDGRAAGTGGRRLGP